MNNKIRYGFTLLQMFFSYFVLALFAPFRQPINQVRQRISYVRQPRRRMAIFLPTLALLLLFCLVVLPAMADSFNTTNNLVSGTQYTLYPTNTTATGTGLPIDLVNYKSVGFYLSGDVLNSNSAPIGVSLVRSDKATTSGITNWETTPIYKFVISVPAQTNHFDWMTNLPEDFVGAAYKVGIEQLTNNFSSGCSISNLEAGIMKKIVPTSLSPR